MRRRLPLALVLVGALLLPAVPATAAPAADTTPPVLRSIELSRSEVTVSGQQTVMVGVRVRLTDDTGVETQVDDSYGYTPLLSFAAAPVNAFVLLVRTEGTVRDGIWTGQIPVTSAWTGVVRTRQLWAYDLGLRNVLDVDPNTVIDAPAITVHSSHRPAVAMSFSPEPATKGKSVTQHVRVTDSDTGLGVANAPLVFAYEVCGEYPGGRITARTDAAGNYQRTVPATQTEYTHCVWVPGQEINPRAGVLNPTMIAVARHRVRFLKFTVSAAPVHASVPAGTSVDVSGVAVPVKPDKTVQLQRLYAGGIWKTVNTGDVRGSGRFTVVATPPLRVTYSYRVYVPADEDAVGSTSPVFTIRGS